jgi:prephenate dehydrogenase
VNLYFRRVCIIGVGLIGGSIALGVQKNKLAEKVVGFFRRKASLKLAEKMGIVEKGYLDIEEALSGSDLIILSTPIAEILRLGKEIRKFLPSDILITDVGSSKSKIVKELSRLYPGYVGSHPLAGSEKRGWSYSRADLFEGRITILIPIKSSDKKAVNLIKGFWKNLGARVVLMSPQAHDRLLSRISHLPHLLMYALMNLIEQEELSYAATGFKDATRIAASEPQLWLEVFSSNQKNILRETSRFIQQLERYQQAIAEGREEMLLNLLRDACRKRKRLK